MDHKKNLNFPGALTPDKGTAERPGASQGRHSEDPTWSDRHSEDPTWSDLSDYLLNSPGARTRHSAGSAVGGTTP